MDLNSHQTIASRNTNAALESLEGIWFQREQSPFGAKILRLYLKLVGTRGYLFHRFLCYVWFTMWNQGYPHLILTRVYLFLLIGLPQWVPNFSRFYVDRDSIGLTFGLYPWCFSSYEQEAAKLSLPKEPAFIILTKACPNLTLILRMRSLSCIATLGNLSRSPTRQILL